MNDNEMNNNNINQDPEMKDINETDNRKVKNLSLPIFIAAFAAIVGASILLFAPGENKKPQDAPQAATEESVSEEQISPTESLSPTPAPTDVPVRHEEKRIIRPSNDYLVYPESYEIDLKSFPEEFSDQDKGSLIDAIGAYAYEEGFTVESAEYANDLMSNTADGIRIFGMTLNGMDDFFVTTVWFPDSDNAGEYLFILDKRTMDAVRQENPVEETISSNSRNSEDSGSESTTPTPTTRPTSKPTPRLTATPIPVPTSDYQPDLLEIRGVPGEIVESFESVEEFRNSIYNFLYDNGIHVTVISADSYYEQYGESIYDFTISASNRTIYARYDAGANEYYYSFEKIS